MAGFQGAGAVRAVRLQGFIGLAVLVFGLVGLVWSLSAQASPASSDVSVPSVVGGIDRSTIPVAPVAAVSQVSFAGTGLVDRRSWADVDADGVPDVVEDALCGLATCANPWDDVDSDGIADWVEFLACGDATCADSRVDSDKDKIPDFVGWQLCGDQGCSRATLLADVDGDGVANWIEAVIAGDATSAVGDEDYNNNGVPDALELAKCLEKRPDNLASTGVSLWSWVFGAIALVGLGTGISGVARRTVEVSK